MDWNPLQRFALEMALVPIERVGVCGSIFKAGLKSVTFVTSFAQHVRCVLAAVDAGLRVCDGLKIIGCSPWWSIDAKNPRN
jgi:hypothetical protein